MTRIEELRKRLEGGYGHERFSTALCDAVIDIEHLLHHIDALTAQVATLRAACEELSKDMHGASYRPCATCRKMTEALGVPFGCKAVSALRDSRGEGGK